MSRSGFEISPGIKVFTGNDHAIGQFVDVASMDFAGCEMDPQGEGYLVEWSQMFGFSQNKIGITVEELGDDTRIKELVGKFLSDNGIKVAWRPEVGKTAWAMHYGSVQEFMVDDIEPYLNHHIAWVWNRRHPVKSKKRGSTNIPTHELFPTAEAALASIKVYDLEGNEVVVSRVLPVHVSGVCKSCGDKLEYSEEEAEVLGRIVNKAYKMDFPDNPEGDARLKAYQERIAGRARPIKQERSEGGC